MSRRALSCRLCLFAAVVAGLFYPSYGNGRTLAIREMWQIYGGATFNNQCCMIVAGCMGVGISCNSFDQMSCPTSHATTVYAGNRNECTGDTPGATCTQADTTHVCLSMNNCVWDTMLGMCVTAGQTSSNSAPDSCADMGCG